ncbi:MAG: superoxide dismutase family protein [Rhizobiaceae bacterium]
MKPVLVPSAFAAALLFSAAASAQEATAFAAMKHLDGTQAGTVTFKETKSGQLRVTFEMTGMKPGPHAVHVHEKGLCDEAGKFESAGPHYSGGKEHGIDHDKGPHAGDLPNVHVGQDGVLKAEFFTATLSLSDGPNPLLDADGSSVMVHAGPDDHASQPGGDAGDRIACGIVQQPS